MLFPCPSASYSLDSFPGELIWIPALGGSSHEVIPCLLLPYETARFLIIFLHSNAEDLGRCRWFCHFMRDQFQVHILAVEYPGYGICAGSSSKDAVNAVADAAFEFVTKDLNLSWDRIIVFGRSIGTGPAIHLAAQQRLAGLVLVTPFTNVRDIFRDRVGDTLASFVDEWFQNAELIKQVCSPTLFIHGRKDEIISYKHSEVLYSYCYAQKLFINPVSMQHNTDLTADASLLIVPMFRFFSLPDYSFGDLEVPPWAFDKKRSHLYVRPEVEVCSSASNLSRAAPPALDVVAGDEEEKPPRLIDADKENSIEKDGLPRRAVCPAGDQPIADAERLACLTQPTVLHSYRATKQAYNFQGKYEKGVARPVPVRSQPVKSNTQQPARTGNLKSQPFQTALGPLKGSTKPIPELDCDDEIVHAISDRSDDSQSCSFKL